MAIFFSSDFHFGDDRYELMRRPFSSSDEMLEFQVEKFNKIVSPEDTVYYLGDLTYWKRTDLVSVAGRLNGTKHLILGNHDFAPIEEYAKYFKTIQMEMNLEITDYNGDPMEVHLVHYPVRAIPEKFNIVGHIHDAWKVQRNMLNVGVDVWHFSPVSERQVAFQINAIRKFYDDDVFVDNHIANVVYREEKSRISSRFDSDIVRFQIDAIEKFNKEGKQ